MSVSYGKKQWKAGWKPVQNFFLSNQWNQESVDHWTKYIEK
jgi:hypothetical protein